MYAPSNIIIIDGELHMKDGSSVKDYLQSWQDSQELPNGSYVNVTEHGRLNDLLFCEQYVAFV